MSYEDYSIRDVVDDLNRSIFLPDIQREFVWKPEQIEKLFDSIMCGYPIGSFLFWRIREEHIPDWTIYEFVEEFDTENPHNKEAETLRIKKDINLVLDGQQRLTSLLIGLKGTYRLHYYKWSKKKLFLNLLKVPKKSDDPDILSYEFKFKESSESNDIKNEFWFNVQEILRFDEAYDLKQYVIKQIPNLLSDNLENVERLLEKLFNNVHTKKLISRYQEKQQDYDTVVEIFVRTNTGGKKLEYSDILLSKATAKWDKLNARKEINEFTDSLNKIGNGYSFDKDFVLKACMYMTQDLPIQYKVGNFTKENLLKIEANWDNIKKFVYDCVKLVNKYKLQNKNITSGGALLPIAYYLLKLGSKNFINSSAKNDVINQINIVTWLKLIFLKNVFGSSSDTTLNNTRDAIDKIKDHSTFPYSEINDELKISPNLTGEEVLMLLDTSYKTKYSFLILSLLYPDRDWKDNSYQEDHIYPKSEFTTAKLKKRGYDEEQIRKYQKNYNSIVNLQLLLDTENNEKRAKDFNEWINTRDEEFKSRHSIPEMSTYEFDDFLEFVNLRKEIIKKELCKIKFYN